MLYKNSNKIGKSRSGIFSKGSVSGFTLVEILVVVSILLIIFGIIVSGFNALNKRQALDKDTLLIKSVLNEARSLTLSSKEASRYGVHFDEFSVTRFQGVSFDSNDPDNNVASLSSYSRVGATNLAGGGSDIIFARLTGATLQDGTITIELRSDDTVTKTITVESTGVVNLN